MYNHDNKDHKSMMWMMVICCLFPLVLILFAGKLSLSGGPRWLIVGVIAVFVILHFSGMSKRKNNDQDQNGQKDNKPSGGSCH